MSGRRGGQPLVLLAVIISVVLVPVAVNLLTANVAYRRETLTWVGAAVTGAALLLTTILGYREVGTSVSLSEEKERAAIQLIQTLASIERSALKVLRGRQWNAMRASRPLSLPQIRTTMLDLDVWTKEDTIGFDIALRARNAIVHGDLKEVDMVDLKYAVEKAKQLLDKVQSSNNAEDK
jgi:hypothetical protein